MKLKTWLFAAAFAAPIVLGSAQGQTPNTTGNEFQTGQTGKAAPGVVMMCLTAGVAAPCPGGGGAVTQGTTPWIVDESTGSQFHSDLTAPATFASQYPSGSVAITASATGTTAATTATLAASASLHTYICGFSIRANATAAATANSTVTGTITGTLNYTQWTAPNASGIGLTEQIFSPCVPSSAINTGIAVISAAPGAGGVVSVAAWGYQL